MHRLLTVGGLCFVALGCSTESLPSLPEGSCIAPAPPQKNAAVRLEAAFSGLPELDGPVYFLESESAPGRYYVVEKGGRILTWTGDGSGATPFADLSSVVDTTQESGLNFMLFDPDFSQNGHVFLSYVTVRDETRTLRFSRFTTGATGPIQLASEEVLLELVKPSPNHNGGSMAFGPDGYLYISIGDGGSGVDDGRHGQDTNSLLGTVIRIDVHGENLPYGIPPDNPFVLGGGRPEIYAYGLRNPWRMHFDRVTGRLWLGDVGEGLVEEVDLIVKGGNYGWNVVEGDACWWRFPDCDLDAFEAPVASFYHADGDNSVTGGFVYRGSEIPELGGVYIFGDFISGRIRGLVEQEDGSFESQLLLDTDLGIASFGQDGRGELYVVDHIGGEIYRLARSEPPIDTGFPTRLSETGCMNKDDPEAPGPNLVPYLPLATLWSDGAAKERWFSLPSDAKITVQEDGDFEFPEGSVLVKAFRRDGRLLETRLYMNHVGVGWAGYSYRWNDAQTDAELVQDASLIRYDERQWLIPSRSQCNQCHTDAAGRSLGLEWAQLNHEFDYPLGFSVSGRRNQLEVLQALELLDGAPKETPVLAAYDSAQTPATRARSYLHANCSNCHRPGGPGRGALDLRVSTDLANTGLCALAALDNFGTEDARIIEPGEPDASVLMLRMRALDHRRMPPIGSQLRDDPALELMGSWISGMSACP